MPQMNYSNYKYPSIVTSSDTKLTMGCPNAKNMVYKNELMQHLNLIGQKKFCNTRFTKDRYFYGEIEFNWSNAPVTVKGKIKRFVFKIQLSSSGESVFKGTVVRNSFSGSIVECVRLSELGICYAFVDKKLQENY